MIFIGVFIGIVLTLIGMFLYATRDEWLRISNIWNDEPDENLKPWFRFIRRLFRSKKL